MTTRNRKKPKLPSHKSAAKKRAPASSVKRAASGRAKTVRGLPDLTDFRASLKMAVTEGSTLEDLTSQDRY